MNFKAGTPPNQHYRGGTKDVFNIRLPITQRGLFFHDQFFQQARSHFEAAVKDVLSKWGDLNSLDDPFLTRTTSPFGNQDSSVFGKQDPMNCGSSVLQEPPALGTLQRYRQLRSQNLKKESQAVTAFEDQHSYKVILDVRDFLHGDMKVTVKHERELVVEGAPSGGKQGFSHKFLMPQGVIIDQTTSVLSSDGVLTIITPKMMKPVKENVSVPIEIKANLTKLQGKDRQKALAASLLKKNIQSKINKQMVEDFKTQVKEEQLNGSNINKNVANHVTNKPPSVLETDIQQGFKPIIRRGKFFTDSIFNDNHTQFNNSVKKAVEKSEQKNTNPMELYRNMRNDDNQNSKRAISVTDGSQIYKITIDVREFTKDGELTVKVIQEKEEKELLVEGHFGHQEPEKSFSQTFTLPQHVDISSISSVLSTDGVLVITGSHKKVSDTQSSNNVPNIQTSNNGINYDLQSPDSAISSSSPQSSSSSRPHSSSSSRPQSSFSSISTPDSLPNLSSLLTGDSTPTPFSFPNTAAQMTSPSSTVQPFCLTPTPSAPLPPLSPEPKYTSFTELKIRPCSSNSSEPSTPSSISCSTPSTVILYKLDDHPDGLYEEEDMDYEDSEDGLMSPGPDPATLEETCTCGLVH